MLSKLSLCTMIVRFVTRGLSMLDGVASSFVDWTLSPKAEGGLKGGPADFLPQIFF